MVATVVLNVETPQPIDVVSVVEVMDMDGGTLRIHESGIGPEEGALLHVASVDGERITVYGRYIHGVDGLSTYVQSTLTRFDGDFGVEWSARFGEIKSLTSQYIMRDFVRSNDGNHLAIGKKGYKHSPGDDWHQGGWLYHFSPLGDSIWGHVAEVPLPYDQLNYGYLNSGGLLSSGSIVAGGTATQDASVRHFWLYRLHCSDTLFCGEPFVSNTKDIDARFGITLSPNPATDRLAVDCAPAAGYNRLRVFDMTGRPCLERPMADAGAEVDVSALPPGLYLLRAEGGRGFATGKFVKE